MGHTLNWRDKSSAGLLLPQSKIELVLYTDDRYMKIDFMVDSVLAVEEFKKVGGVVEVEPFEIQIGLCVVLRDPWRNLL